MLVKSFPVIALPFVTLTSLSTLESRPDFSNPPTGSQRLPTTPPTFAKR